MKPFFKIHFSFLFFSFSSENEKKKKRKVKKKKKKTRDDLSNAIHDTISQPSLSFFQVLNTQLKSTFFPPSRTDKLRRRKKRRKNDKFRIRSDNKKKKEKMKKRKSVRSPLGGRFVVGRSGALFVAAN